MKIIDAEKASYGNDNVMFAVTEFAQLAMRSAIGKMQLDKTFMERDNLNAKITVGFPFNYLCIVSSIENFSYALLQSLYFRSSFYCS